MILGGKLITLENMNIESFKITGLHKALNFEFLFNDNTLILLGENGSCKTTIIKMLYYTLSLQWGKLAQYNFESIEIKIDAEAFYINREDLLLSSLSFNDRIFRRLPPPIRRYLMTTVDRNETLDFQKLEDICRRYEFPIEIILQELDSNEDIDLFSKKGKNRKQLQKSISTFKETIGDIHILYLPTYRRIEQELKVVLDGRIDEDEFVSRRIKRYDNEGLYTELIEFGMRDVDDAIQNMLTNLKESSRANLNQLTLGYLDDIVNEKYKTINIEEINSIDETTIHDIMNRVDELILSNDSKLKLSKTLQTIKENGIKTDHDKVVCHYFLKLYDSHKELLGKETSIRDFVEICNRYLENKSMSYDSPNFSFYIQLNEREQNIGLPQLSSGEKQIVSLFNHLYLSNKKEYIVLIDEPELSLSVKWQKTFLEDVCKGSFCKGLVAVTHSPFIFDNSLDKYAHGIEEFRVEK